MNLYAYVTMPIEKNNRLYQISLPIGAPYTECLEVLDEAIKNVNELIALNEAEKKKQEEEKLKEQTQ